MVGRKQAHAPCMTPSTKHSHHGHQQAQRLEWAAHAYHKKEGATLHYGPWKHSLQYDRTGQEDGQEARWTLLGAGWDVQFRLV